LAFVSSTIAQKNINVLLYNGPSASQDDVEWSIGCFNWANQAKLVPGVTLVSKRSSRVSATTLQGMDVLLMPGGMDFYPQTQYVDVAAAKKFVQNGGGYYGTCAGAYAACTTIYGDTSGAPISGGFNLSTPWQYDQDGRPFQQGWGISHANCHVFYYVGTANLAFTDSGSKILNYTGTVPVDHHNGPAMDGGGDVAATFADTRQRGKNAIVSDTYGTGRVIQIAPHPEHSRLQKCMMVARAALWAGKGV
jgi:glutamine amidotransferase-like uncharacterized protein